MSKTQNIGLYKQDDGATQWGEVLNNNFDIIDTKVNQLESLIGTSTLSSGLTTYISTPTISGTTINIPSFECFFNVASGTKNFSITQGIEIDLSDVTTSAYLNCYFGVKLNDQSAVEGWYTTNLSTVQNTYINDPAYIFIGSIAKDTSGLQSSTLIVNPWFSNVSMSDRITNFLSLGVVNGLSLRASGNSLRPESSGYYWTKEGLNYSSSNGDYHIKKDFLSLIGSNIQFYRAVANAILSSEELVLQTTIDYKYYNSTNAALVTITSGKYSIMRFGVIGNGNAVVFYGNAEYDTLSAAQDALVSQSALNTFIRVKEIARIIVSSNSIIGVYNLDNLKTALLQYTTKFDNEKKQYVFADASEIRTNGIVPETGKISAAGVISDLTLCFADNTFGSGSISYVDVDAETISAPSTTGFYFINIDSNRDITYDSAYDNNKICLGWGLKSAANSYTHDITAISPEYCTTHRDMRNDFRTFGVKALNCIYTGDNNTKKLQLSSSANNLLTKEGCGYLNNNITTNNISISDIKFRYFNPNTNTFLSDETDTIANQYIGTGTWSSGYTIQKLIVLANGERIMVPGRVIYSTIPTNLYDGLDTYLNINSAIGVEVGRFVIGLSSGVISIESSYYTNQKISGQVKIEYMNASQIESLPSTAHIGSIYFNYTGSSTVTLKSSETGYVDLDRITTNATNIGTNTTDIATNTSSIDTLNNTTIPALQTTISGHTTSINTLVNTTIPAINTTISNLFTFGSTAPTRDTSHPVWIDTSNNKVYINDGTKWQLMNSWQ